MRHPTRIPVRHTSYNISLSILPTPSQLITITITITIFIAITIAVIINIHSTNSQQSIHLPFHPRDSATRGGYGLIVNKGLLWAFSVVQPNVYLEYRYVTMTLFHSADLLILSCFMVFYMNMLYAETYLISEIHGTSCLIETNTNHPHPHPRLHLHPQTISCRP